MTVKARIHPNDTSKQVQDYARLAFPLMTQHEVPPTPENYAIWFHFVAADIPDLQQEMDMMIEQGRPFTPDINRYLYSRFIANNLKKLVLEKSADDAQQVLMQVMQALEGITDSTSDYSKTLDQYSGIIKRKAADTKDLKSVADTIIEVTTHLKQRSDQLNDELRASSREVDNLRSDLRKVVQEAQKDFLTGVLNRQGFDEKLKEHMLLAEAEERDLCLLILDVDHFKKFNDKYGHQIGDHVLKQVARTLQDSVKGNDVVARYGGEEFAIILPSTPLSGALVVAENLRHAISTKSLRRRDTGDLIDPITISIGISYWHRSEDALEGFIKRADDALYRSKNAGRNRVSKEEYQKGSKK